MLYTKKQVDRMIKDALEREYEARARYERFERMETQIDKLNCRINQIEARIDGHEVNCHD